MKKSGMVLFIISVLLIGRSALASERPIKLASDSRIETVVYSPDNIVPMNGTTLTTTQIVFGQDEYIENVQNGDLGAWTVSISQVIPNMMFIKPTAYHSNTNMTVITNKHTYYFHLSSNLKGQASPHDATYAIRFIYPSEKKEKIERAIIKHEQQKQVELSHFKKPSNCNWDYSFSGDRSLVPIHVFDDGRFTYLQLQPNQAIPAVFAITSPSGKESVVNYHRDGQYVIVQSVVPQLTLRLGKDHVASVFNNQWIAKWRNRRYSL